MNKIYCCVKVEEATGIMSVEHVKNLCETTRAKLSEAIAKMEQFFKRELAHEIKHRERQRDGRVL